MATSEQPSVRPRVLGLDLGRKRIGAAISDPFGWTAQPLETIRVESIPDALAHLQTLVRRHEVATIVVGLPLNMDGSQGEQALWVRRTGERLARDLADVPIVYWDERLTTSVSESVLIESGMTRKKRKEHRDRLAAMLILQSYLDFQRRNPAEPKRPNS